MFSSALVAFVLLHCCIMRGEHYITPHTPGLSAAVAFPSNVIVHRCFQYIRIMKISTKLIWIAYIHGYVTIIIIISLSNQSGCAAHGPQKRQRVLVTFWTRVSTRPIWYCCFCSRLLYNYLLNSRIYTIYLEKFHNYRRDSHCLEKYHNAYIYICTKNRVLIAELSSKFVIALLFLLLFASQWDHPG